MVLRDAPNARILGRNIVLRQEKLFGRILAPDGRSIEAIPIDPWAESRDSADARSHSSCHVGLL